MIWKQHVQVSCWTQNVGCHFSDDGKVCVESVADCTRREPKKYMSYRKCRSKPMVFGGRQIFSLYIGIIVRQIF